MWKMLLGKKPSVTDLLILLIDLFATNLSVTDLSGNNLSGIWKTIISI
jgi:hypothetical protein